MRGDRGGVVFIGEDMGPEPYLLTGRFSAHWEAGDAIHHEQGPTGASLAEALEWGRGRADVVYVRLADSDVHHAAGASNPHDDPVWPEDTEVARRRSAGMEHLDLVAEEPIFWRARRDGTVISARGRDENTPR